MMLYAYVPADDREYIRRCGVPSEDLNALEETLIRFGALDRAWRLRQDLERGAPGVEVALDFLGQSHQAQALMERLHRETKVRRWLLYRSGQLPRELLIEGRANWSWRECFRPYLAAVLRQLDGQEKKHQDQALREAFPAGQRKHYPYKTWLDEIRVQRGLKAPPRRPERAPQVRMDHPRQELLFGGVS